MWVIVRLWLHEEKESIKIHNKYFEGVNKKSIVWVWYELKKNAFLVNIIKKSISNINSTQVKYKCPKITLKYK